MSDLLLCEQREGSCLCTAEGSHKLHVCACGGEWTGSGDTFEPVTFPYRFVGSSGNRTVKTAVSERPLRPDVTPVVSPTVRPRTMLLSVVLSIPWWIGMWHIMRWIF